MKLQQVLEEMLNLMFQNLKQPLTNMSETCHKEQILLLKFLYFLLEHTEVATEKELCGPA